jgi:AcrR family transcriptional regulator
MSSKPRKRRLPPEDREREIVRGAVAFFAEFGFEGGTRELAARLGVTQPLLYRYFPSKEALLDRVYQEVYLSRWDPQWEGRLADRSVPLERRLTAFYAEYARVILTYEWVRLFMFAGLKGLDFNSRYLAFLRGAVFERVVVELRDAHGLPADTPPRPEEIELVWGLHASIFYLGVRRWIYKLPTPPDLEGDIGLKVLAFLRGAPAVFEQLGAAKPAEPALL